MQMVTPSYSRAGCSKPHAPGAGSGGSELRSLLAITSHLHTGLHTPVTSAGRGSQPSGAGTVPDAWSRRLDSGSHATFNSRCLLQGMKHKHQTGPSSDRLDARLCLSTGYPNSIRYHQTANMCVACFLQNCKGTMEQVFLHGTSPLMPPGCPQAAISLKSTSTEV